MIGSDLRLRVIELVRADFQISHDLGREIHRGRVVQKGVDHRLHVEVEHSVGQRRAHVVADRAVEAGVAGGDHLPAVGQPVIADPAIEDQGVGRDLEPLIGRGEFVEKQDAIGLSVVGRNSGGNHTVFASVSSA